jgi:hypothetical protein
LGAAACGSDEEKVDCIAACAGLECGVVGDCTCGGCKVDEECKEGVCCTKDGGDCAAVCAGGHCGEIDGCDCGGCAVGEVCGDDSLCVADPCVASCQGLQCGTADGCDCGSCAGDEVCSAVGVCEAPDLCVELCAGRECGEAKGCDCGSCAAGHLCDEGSCVCEPLCEGKVCGGDGCGGSCGACGSGLACGKDGQCHTTECLDEIVFQEAQKIHEMSIGDGGHPGEALDVDGDPDTCAPDGDCEGGLNNQLSGLLDQIVQFVDANAELAKALDEGTIVLLAETVDFADDGSAFTLNMYLGDPVADKETCDFQVETCDYLVDPGSFDLSTCLPLIAFDNATVTDGVLTAGGPEYLFTVSIPVSEGLVLDVTAHMAQIVGTIVGEGSERTITDGLVGGAIRKKELIESVEAVPDEMFEGSPVSKPMIINIIEMFIVPDVDTDDDDEADAASVGIKFATIPAVLTGVGAEE